MNSLASLRRSISPSLILLSVAVFLLALLPRLGALNRYITPDELRWVDRSLHFADALSRGDLASTIQSGHPGITTMWLGSLGIRALSAQHALPATWPEFDPQNAEAARFLAQYLTAARWPVIFVVAINVVVLFWLLDRLIDRRAASLAAGLIALDPFAVALGGILHVDALLVTFSLNALAALCVALNRVRPTRWLMLSGAFAGLAALSKSPGVILGIAALIVLLADDLRHRRTIVHTIKAALIWGVSALVIFVLLTPSMWVQPIGTLQLISSMAEKFSETAHAVNYFNGSTNRDPGPLFYPVVIAFRSTPVLWLGLIAGVALIARTRSESDQGWRSIAWVYGVFVLVFLGVITLSAKKLDRYVLPALEALVIVGAWGLAFVIQSIGTRLGADDADKKRAWILNGLAAIALLIQAMPFMQVWPLTLRAYNPLLGGYDAAKKMLPVGGGEGAEVGQALSRSAYAKQTVALSDVVGTAPYDEGQLTTNDAAGLTQADYLLSTAADFQLTPQATQTWIGHASPVLTITVQGQPYAWLYPNQWLTADRRRFAEKYRRDDVVLADYAAALPALNAQIISAGMDEAGAIQLLRQIALSHDRVWVVHYIAAPRRVLSSIFRVLDTYAVTLDQWSSPLSEGTLYTLPDNLSFTAQPTPLNSDVHFGDHIHLTEASLIVPHVQPGQSIGIVSEWRAAGPAAQTTVSVVDAAGHAWTSGGALIPLTNDDNTPRPRRINVPAPLTMPPGQYQLVLTVIDTATGSPINARKRDGSIGGMDWPLGSVTIDPAQTLIDPATRKPPITLNVDLGGITAIGTERPPNPIVSGDPWTLAMEWAATADHLPALDVRWEWVRTGTVVYSTTLPLNPYSTEQWRKGEVLQSKYDFRVPIDVKNGAYDLQFKVIERVSGRPLNDKAIRLTSVNVASRPRDFTAPAAVYPLDVKFDEAAKLVGADVERSGGVLTVTLFWQGQTITTTNDTVFVQLIGPEGSIEQQIDNWQIAFDAPTSTWLPGQVIADRYEFAASSGGLQIGVGLYNASNGERLPAFDALGQRLPQDRMVFAVK